MSPNARGWIIAGGLSLAFAALVLWSARGRTPAPAPPPGSGPTPSAPPIAPEAAPLAAACDRLAAEYKQVWANLAYCQTDADCAVEERGKHWSGLDGCARIGSRTAPKGAADQIAEEWLGAGCAHEADLCPRAPRAQCRARRCVELPPPPIPADWSRVHVADLYSLFVPGDLAPAKVQAEDTIATALEGGGRSLFVSWGTHYAPDDPDADVAERLMPWVKVERRQALTVSKRAVTLLWAVDPGSSGAARDPFLAEALVPDVAAPWYSMLGSSGAILFELRCEKKELCDVAPLMLGSLEVVSQPFDPGYP